ncbi:hypothetical protein HYW42_04835 [Candidatus Daviesbacteria bacterium]|nr:hypothetical protein [Candidatus Daviesbacteria bacterium]
MERLPISFREVGFYLAGEYQATSIADFVNARRRFIEDAITEWPEVQAHLVTIESVYVGSLYLAHLARERTKHPENREPFYYYGVRVQFPTVRHSPDFDPKDDPNKLTVFDHTGKLELYRLSNFNPLIWQHATTAGIYADFKELRANTWLDTDVVAYALFTPVFSETVSLLGVTRKPVYQTQEQVVFDASTQRVVLPQETN